MTLPLTRRRLLGAAAAGLGLAATGPWLSRAASASAGEPAAGNATAEQSSSGRGREPQHGGGRVLTRSHGLPVDHVALGVPDMPAALERIERDTGARPYATDPEPGQWYWSGALALGEDSFLEILGPNPDHRGFQPIKQLISGYTDPRLLFWYVATDDFARFRERAEQAGAPVERVETVDYERDGRRVHYQRGIVGPGFVTQRPCVIEWRARHERDDVDRSCRLEGFRLAHPDADAMNDVFGALGIAVQVERGPSWVALDLATPNGRVTYENAGEDFSGVGSVLQMAGLYFSYLFGSGR